MNTDKLAFNTLVVIQLKYVEKNKFKYINNIFNIKMLTKVN